LFRLVQEIKQQITGEIESIGIRIDTKIDERISQSVFQKIKQIKGDTGKDGKDNS